MGQAMDFQKLRKKRQRIHSAKRLAALIAVTGLIFGVIFLNSYLVEEGVTARISDVVGSVGGTGYPVDLPGGIIRDVKNAGNHLAVLNDTNLYVYNKSGKLVNNIQKMNDNSVLYTGNDRLLAFHVGSKEFGVYSRTKTLLESELDYSILAGTMNDQGDFALVSSSNRFVAEIAVYNKRQEAVGTWYFADNLVSTLSISPKGNTMAVGCINAEEGVLLSSVEFFPLNATEKTATVYLPENLILDVRYLDEDRVAVLTDRQYLVADSSGTIVSSYSYEGQIRAFEMHNRQVLLLCENRETRTYEVTLLDSDSNVRSSEVFADKILDMALVSRHVYLLTEEGIETYSTDLEWEKSLEERGVSHIHTDGSRVYYLTKEEICQLS